MDPPEGEIEDKAAYLARIDDIINRSLFSPETGTGTDGSFAEIASSSNTETQSPNSHRVDLVRKVMAMGKLKEQPSQQSSMASDNIDKEESLNGGDQSNGNVHSEEEEECEEGEIEDSEISGDDEEKGEYTDGEGEEEREYTDGEGEEGEYTDEEGEEGEYTDEEEEGEYTDEERHREDEEGSEEDQEGKEENQEGKEENQEENVPQEMSDSKSDATETSESLTPASLHDSISMNLQSMKQSAINKQDKQEKLNRQMQKICCRVLREFNNSAKLTLLKEKLHTNMEKLTKALTIYNYVFSLFTHNGCAHVKVLPQLDLCEDSCRRMGCKRGDCDKLHMCKFFMLGQRCLHGKKETSCRYGHTVNNPHNAPLLESYLLDKLEPDEVVSVLRQRRSAATVPKVCKHYNFETGCRHKTEGEGCVALHVCKYFIKGECRFADGCIRSHSLQDEQPATLLQKCGLDPADKNICQRLSECYEQGYFIMPYVPFVSKKPQPGPKKTNMKKKVNVRRLRKKKGTLRIRILQNVNENTETTEQEETEDSGVAGPPNPFPYPHPLHPSMQPIRPPFHRPIRPQFRPVGPCGPPPPGAMFAARPPPPFPPSLRLPPLDPRQVGPLIGPPMFLGPPRLPVYAPEGGLLAPPPMSQLLPPPPPPPERSFLSPPPDTPSKFERSSSSLDDSTSDVAAGRHSEAAPLIDEYQQDEPRTRHREHDDVLDAPPAAEERRDERQRREEWRREADRPRHLDESLYPEPPPCVDGPTEGRDSRRYHDAPRTGRGGRDRADRRRKRSLSDRENGWPGREKHPRIDDRARHLEHDDRHRPHDADWPRSSDIDLQEPPHEREHRRPLLDFPERPYDEDLERASHGRGRRRPLLDLPDRPYDVDSERTPQGRGRRGPLLEHPDRPHTDTPRPPRERYPRQHDVDQRAHHRDRPRPLLDRPAEAREYRCRDRDEYAENHTERMPNMEEDFASHNSIWNDDHRFTEPERIPDHDERDLLRGPGPQDYDDRDPEGEEFSRGGFQDRLAESPRRQRARESSNRDPNIPERSHLDRDYSQSPRRQTERDTHRRSLHDHTRLRPGREHPPRRNEDVDFTPGYDRERRARRH